MDLGGTSIDDSETYALLGAGMAVHRFLGCGFLEAVYQEAFQQELTLRKIVFEREKGFPIHYKGRVLPVEYRADFVCCESIIVELKAQHRLTNIDEAQVLNYLKASGLSRALLLNFGARSLEYKRLIWTHSQLTN